MVRTKIFCVLIRWVHQSPCHESRPFFSYFVSNTWVKQHCKDTHLTMAWCCFGVSDRGSYAQLEQTWMHQALSQKCGWVKTQKAAPRTFCTRNIRNDVSRAQLRPQSSVSVCLMNWLKRSCCLQTWPSVLGTKYACKAKSCSGSIASHLKFNTREVGWERSNRCCQVLVKNSWSRLYTKNIPPYLSTDDFVFSTESCFGLEMIVQAPL